MLLKTKLLLSLGSVGVLGGTGGGFYYGVIKNKDKTGKKAVAETTTPPTQNAGTEIPGVGTQPPAVPASPSTAVDTAAAT